MGFMCIAFEKVSHVILSYESHVMWLCSHVMHKMSTHTHVTYGHHQKVSCDTAMRAHGHVTHSHDSTWSCDTQPCQHMVMWHKSCQHMIKWLIATQAHGRVTHSDANARTQWGESKLATDNSGIVLIPVGREEASPYLVIAHLHSSSVIPTHQPHIACMKRTQKELQNGKKMKENWK